MDIFRKRPLMICCSCFLVSAAIGFCISGTVKQILIAVLALTAVIITALLLAKREKKSGIRFAVILTAVIFATVALLESFVFFDIYKDNNKDTVGKSVVITATVSSERSVQAGYSSYNIELESVNGNKTAGKALLDVNFDAKLRAGDVIEAVCEGTELSGVTNGKGAEISLLSDGIVSAFTINSYSDNNPRIIGSNKTPNIYFSSFNQKLSFVLTNSIGGEEGRLASAVLLGNRRELLSETKRDFSRNGISHVLSISGMHMAIIAGVAELLLRLIKVKKTVRCFIVPVVLFLYLALTGFSLSAIRAALMLTCVYVSFVHETPVDPMTVLFAVCSFILLLLPSSAADIGFWMSFLATFGILVIAPMTNRMFPVKSSDKIAKKTMKRVLRYICSALAVTLSANFSVLFITWIAFGKTALLSPLVNLIAAPCVTVIMVISVVCLVFSGIPFICVPATWLLRLCCRFMLAVTDRVSTLRGAEVSLRQDFTGIIIIIFCISILVLLSVKLKHKAITLVPLAALVVVFTACVTITGAVDSEKYEMTYLRRGNSEMLNVTGNGKTVICDISDGYYTNLNTAYQDATENNCATETEVLVLTHYHTRHIESVERFISSYRVRYIWMPEPITENETYIVCEIVKAAEKHGVKCYAYEIGEEFTLLGGCRFTVLPHMYTSGSEQPSVSVSLTVGSETVLLVGSSYSELGGDIANTVRQETSVTLIYGSHGPSPKENWHIDNGENVKKIIVADRNDLELAYTEETNTGIITDCERYKVTFSD